MNLFYILAILIAIAFKSTTGAIIAKDINVIIERTEGSITEAAKLISEHKANNRGHLLDAAQHEFEYLSKLLPLIKNLTTRISLQTEQLNKVEEVLLKRENALTEELYFVEEIYRNYQPKLNSTELEQFAVKIIKEANDLIKKKSDYKHERWEITRLRMLVSNTEKLLKNIKNASKDAKKVQLLEGSLVGGERSMRNIIEKLTFEF